MKPVYFGVHEMDMEVNGNPTKFPVPVFSKLSSIKVSGELAKRFPAMAKLKEYMETHNIDEIHSSGAVKLGRDTNLLTVEDIRNNVAPDGKKLMLSNRNYRMQFNPKSKVDSSVSIFTQLMYFMNILDTNVTEVEQAYAAVAMLMENSLVDLMDEFSTDGQLNPAKIKASVANTMTSPGNERLAQLLRAGVSLNNPTVANKAFTQLASIFEKSIQKIKFPGAKLVLQTDEFIKKNADPGVETASNVRARLKYVRTSRGGFAAEVVVPQTMLTPDLREALARGEELYLTGDYFGFRIPSTELHSAVPLKVVGVYDSKGTNVIIAPYELVYLHGSDFDVDSLFVVKRSMFSKQEREILGIKTTVADLPVGCEQKGRKLVFSADTINSYKKKIDSLRIDLNKKGFDNPELAQVILGETKKLNRLEKKIEEKFAKNTIFELMMNVITKPENRKRMMTPIIMNSFNDLDNNLSVASYLQELGLWESKLTKDLSRADYALEAHKFVQDGAILTGVFANNIKVLSYLYRAGQNFQPAKVKDNLVIRFNVAGKEEVFDRVSDYDRETGTLMWQYQDGLVNLAIDNLNEQTLSKLGVNLQTGNAFVALLGLGFPLKDAVLLMKTELAELISKNRPFDKVAYLSAYKKQNDLRVTTKVLSTKDLEKAATKGLDLSKSEDREIQAGIVDILVKAFTMGNSAFKLSRVLKTIRTVPGTPEKLYQWLDAVEDVFGSVPYELSRGIRKYNSPTELREAHKSNVKTNPVSNSFAYDIPNLLPSTPHVLSSIRSTLILKQVAQSAIFKLSDNHREFAKSILKSMEFKGFGLDKITIEDIIEELEHFLFASLNPERIKEVKDYQYRQRKTRLTHFSAFANYLADKITKAMEVEKALQLLDKTYVINQFLENLVINRRNGIVNIRLANAISPDAADVAAIRHGFDRLPQDMQEDLITYLIIATGFKLSATSFAPYVDEAKYVSKDKVFSEASEKFATSVEMRDMYTSPFRVALAFKYADKLPYFNKNQRKYMKYANDTGGYESGVYYDMKMDQAEMPEELRTFPEFVAIINWPNEEAGRHWKEYEVYRRINKPVKDSLRPIFYQKIGRKTFDGYYVDPTTYSIANNLPSDIRRVFVYDLDNPFTFNKKVFDRLREDQEVLFASYDDPMGVRSYRATIVAKHKVDLGFGDFKYTFTLKDKKYLSEKLPADDVKIDNTPDTETQDPKSTFAAARDFVDPRIKKATTGYSPEFQAFIKDSERVKEDPSDKNFYLVDNGDRVLRVSADMGPINKLRARPFEKDHEERARAIVESAWKERDPNHKLKVKGLEGEYTKDAAFDALVEKFVNIADRGTLLHKFLHLATVTSPAVQERIVSEINELQSRLRYNASWLVQDGGVEKVFKKAGLNIFDDVTSESVDRIYSELSIVDTVYTKWGGTADLIYQKANGLFGIRDFKTGWGFNNVEARAMFKYGGGATKNIMQTPRNTAKLQLMLYAFLMKIKNPSAKFDTLEITWIPDPEKVFFNDPDRFVEVRDYLNMIHSYIKREMPEVYAKMKQEMTKENFAKLWDFNEYEASFMLNSTLAEQKKEGKSLLKEKLDELRMFTFFSLAEHEGPSKKTQKTKYEKQAAIIFKEVMDLVNDIGVKEHEINDISFLSLWLSSNAHQLSGYIQLYDKMLKKAKAKVDARKTVYRTKFKHKMEAWLDDHHRVYGKSPLEYIPFTKGLLNFYRSEELFGWLYKDVKDKDGYIVGKQIRSSEADWKEAEEAFPKYSKWAERKAFAKFLTDTYDSFFVDEKSEYGVAVANRTATYRDKTDPETGEIVEVQVSNLDLQNEYRRHRDAASFVYETGWFPKVPKLLEEIGTLFTKEYWQEV